MSHSSDKNRIEQVRRRSLLFFDILRALLYLLIEAVILFLAAGRLDWPMAWLYLAGYSIYLFLSERIAPLKSKSPSGKKTIWESVLVFIYRITHPIILVLAGFEFNRFPLSVSFGIVMQIIMFLFLLATFALMLWAEKTNPYYRFPVLPSKKWEQRIVATGPYQFIRHPGYLGLIMLALVRPLVLGSLLGLAPGIIGAIVIILLTALEDRALQTDLDGYKSYAQSVKYRLFEGIW